MDSTDQVVMGGQNQRDTLVDMPRFGGRSVQESEVFQVWLKDPSVSILTYNRISYVT